MKWYDSRPSFVKRYINWWEWNVQVPAQAIAGYCWYRMRGQCVACRMKLPTHKMGCLLR